MSAKRRKNGEGSWGEVVISGKKYVRFKKDYEGYGMKSFYGATTKDVNKKIKEFEKQMSVTNDSAIAKMTTGEFLSNWIENVKIKQVAKSTFHRDKQTFKYYIRNYDIANIQVAALTYKDIEEHLEVLSRKYSKSTIDKVYFMFNQCCKHAVKVGELTSSPVERVSRIKEENVAVKKKPAQFLELEDVNRLVIESKRTNEAKKKGMNGKVGDPVYGINAHALVFIIFTGVRIGEMLALRWNDINYKDKLVFIDESRSLSYDDSDEKYEFRKTKTATSTRHIPLSEKALEALKEMEKFHPNHKNSDLILLSNRGNTPSQSTVQRTLNKMLRNANCDVQKCNLHGLRHTFGSLLLNEGQADIATISTLLGHKDITTTVNIYVHVLNKLKVKAIKIFDNM